MRPSNSLIVNGAIGSASFNSGPVWAYDIVRCSVQVSVPTGGVNGSLQLQASNDQFQGVPPNQFQPTNWSNVGTASVTFSTTSTAKTFLIVETECCYEYLRVAFTDSTGGAGTGALTVRMKAFGL